LNVAGYSTPGNASGGYMTTPVDFTGQSVNHRMMDSFTWRKF
jgi:hypothetical protein